MHGLQAFIAAIHSFQAFHSRICRQFPEFVDNGVVGELTTEQCD
jgi:hypothetical protein